MNRGYIYRKRVGSEASGLTVLEYLARRYRHSSERDWRARIARGRVRLDDTRVAPETRLSAGQIVTWHRPPWVEPEAPTGFAVLFEDEDLLVVAKPRGLPTLPGGGFLLNTLLERVRRYAPGARPLHRLGRGTSGLALFAKTRFAYRTLGAGWHRGEVRRRYLALSGGVLKQDSFEVMLPIGRVPHAGLGSVYAVCHDGKPAQSRLRVVERRKKTTLVAVDLVTGRPHQIRIHLAAIGHPLVGDRLYPEGGVPEPMCTVLPGESGYWLHAEGLGFRHPRSQRQIDVLCGPPPVLRPGYTEEPRSRRAQS